jgi:glycosyltransferase involved in cell wall biosynthesis
MRSNHFRVEAANVHFLGPKPYGELPYYLRHIDVCVLPWRIDNAFTSYGSAIKVKEYLATGKPVVIAPLYEYLETPGIRTYRGVAEFIAAIEDALRHDTPAMSALRQESVRAATWDARARQIGQKLAEMC